MGGQQKRIDFPNRPTISDKVEFSENFGRRFIVTVDTEEEFDWSKPFERSGYQTSTTSVLQEFQTFCDEYEVCPVYLVDYPIMMHDNACKILAGFVENGKASVGVQLHPWVNPPFEEEINNFNSFAGNLQKPLEEKKFTILRDLIVKKIGVEPIIYRAGRYGVGPNTARLLADNEIKIDSSVRSNFDYSHEHGPNFTGFPLVPYWIDRAAGLMEVPLTTVFSGYLRKYGSALYPKINNSPRLRGIFSRTGLLERIALTPEGITEKEAIKAIDIAIESDIPILNFSFHSPSLRPGHTPYVNDRADLMRFYDWFKSVFEHMKAKDVLPATIDDILRAPV